MNKYIILEKNTEIVKTLKTIIDSFKDMEFFGNPKNHKEALSLIFKNNLDIIFLDIDDKIEALPEFILDIAQHIKKQPVFIALSTSKENAYKTYRYNFFDYLLKPLTELTISRSIMKYKKIYPCKILEMICLKSNKDYNYLNTDEILFLKADNNTTDFYMKDGSIVGAYKTLKKFENTLPKRFLRIHKSYIINSYCISRIHYGKAICIIKNPSYKIPFTKTFIKNINSINEFLLNNAFTTPN